MMHKIVTIGGGSGQYALLAGLRDLELLDITAIVSMVDSGGSTGRLRDELGILPPGDALKCILALSPHRDIARTIFLKRFTADRRLAGHNAGNMLITMLSRYTGSFPSGIQALAEILDVRGHILPVTIDKATLVAELTDGTRIYGETAIDMPRGTQREKIRDVFLVPHHSDTISVYPPVLKAIRQADMIVIGPGDLFTSIVPSLIVRGLKEGLQKSKAPVLFILNIMNGLWMALFTTTASQLRNCCCVTTNKKRSLWNSTTGTAGGTSGKSMRSICWKTRPASCVMTHVNSRH
jgi:uncharacterized cofD-like protein